MYCFNRKYDDFGTSYNQILSNCNINAPQFAPCQVSLVIAISSYIGSGKGKLGGWCPQFYCHFIGM